MRLPYDIIVFDVESNQPSKRIIEIGAVRLRRNFEIADSFQSWVCPVETISQDIIRLCQLSDEDLEAICRAPRLHTVGAKFYEWATRDTRNVVLASWGNFDVTQLHSQWPECPFRRKALDVKSIARWELSRRNITSTDSLSGTFRVLGKLMEGTPHRAQPDAFNTAYLLAYFASETERIRSSLREIAKIA